MEFLYLKKFLNSKVTILNVTFAIKNSTFPKRLIHYLRYYLVFGSFSKALSITMPDSLE